MEKKKKMSEFVMIIIMIIIRLQAMSCCVESERNALLQLKFSFNSKSPLLSSWDAFDGSDCCNWERVECNSTTGHVVLLDLSYVTDVDYMDLNASLFLPFQQLTQLNLEGNSIAGWNENEAFKGMSSLKTLYMQNNQFRGPFNFTELDGLSNLQVLDLSGNNITKLIISRESVFKSLENLYLNESYYLDLNSLQNIGVMRSLKTLSLLKCRLSGKIPASHGLCDLEHLENLYMQYNYLNGDLPLCFANLTSLRLLDLAHNQFTRKISPLQSLTSLQYLDLSSNQFNKSISHLQNLTSLQYLDLSKNQFNESISHLQNLTSLQYLYLFNNHFSGNISPLRSLTSLQNLDLSNNFLQIPVSLTPLFNISQLRILSVRDNSIYADAEDQNSNPKFQLEKVSMIGYGEGVASIPKFLYHQHSLQSVHISSIKLRGMFPYWLLENNTRLHTLYLSNNSLSGNLQLPNTPHMSLEFLDISHNFFSGYIPSQIGMCFQMMEIANISCNNLTGIIPSNIGDMYSIKALNLSHNSLTRRIPPAFSNLRDIESLDLSYNMLQGIIPDQLTQLTSLAFFNVSYNNLSGQTPEMVARFATFDERSYIGNPFLCGWPLPENCTAAESSPSNATASPYTGESKSSFIDMEDFYVCFSIAYVTVLLALIAVLYINPYWRRVWFYYVQESINKTYYVISLFL